MGRRPSPTRIDALPSRPGYATDLPATYMYAMAFSRGDIGQAASAAMLMMMVVFAIIVPYLYSELRAKHD